MRLDKELQADVIRELAWEPKVESANIGVAVDKGAVTLTGHVNTYAELIAAERAALRLYGVLAVANELVVKLHDDRTRDDSDIALAISNQMVWNAAVPPEAIKATVTHGWVSLEGHVDWAYQSEAADKIGRGLIGVKGVTNRVIVKPAVHYKNLKAKITDALHRQAQIDAHRIWLTTDDGHMTLHGHVSSWLATAKSLLFRRPEPPPDLGCQLEELLIEVWRQEAFERKHPFTCAVIRRASSPLQFSRSQ